MLLQNLHKDNDDVIYWTVRNLDGSLSLKKKSDFSPYFYEPVPKDYQGEVYEAYDGMKVKKILVSRQRDIRKQASHNAYESDISLERRALINAVASIEKSPTKFVFLDIENQIKNRENTLPNYLHPVDLVSCVTLYDNYSKEYVTKFIGADYGEYEGLTPKQREIKLLQFIIDYFKEKQPDIFVAYNASYDYNYLYARVKEVLKINFAEAISPFGKSRYIWNQEGVEYPIGIAIVDYLEMYKKFTLNKLQSYSADFVLEHERGTGKKYKDCDFRTLDPIIAERNLDDVKGIIESVENKYMLITNYYDDIRRQAHLNWEDTVSVTTYQNGRQEWHSNNSKFVDNLCLLEAKELGVVLPNKPKPPEKMTKQVFDKLYKNNRDFLPLIEECTQEQIRTILETEWTCSCGAINYLPSNTCKECKKEFEILPAGDLDRRHQFLLHTKSGAFRESFRLGRFKNLQKVDIAGAYPAAIIMFNLDVKNIFTEPVENSIRVDLTYRLTGELIQTYYIKQDPSTLFPRLAGTLVNQKEEKKHYLHTLEVNSAEWKEKKIEYNTAKAKVNSLPGVAGESRFRFASVAHYNLVTFLVRDCVSFVIEECENNLQSNLQDLLGITEELDSFYCNAVYCDTDSIFLDTNVLDIAQLVNLLSQKWAQSKYGIDSLIKFDHEGFFTKILITGKCRYIGYLQNLKGEVEKEIKGVQAKRSDSRTYQKTFQTEYIDYILDQHTEEECFQWLVDRLVNIRSTPIEDISKPLKQRQLSYESDVQVMKVQRYTRALVPDYKKEVNELFYIVEVEPYGTEYEIIITDCLDGKPINLRQLKTEWLEQFKSYKTGAEAIKSDAYTKLRVQLVESGRLTTISTNKVKNIFDIVAWDKKHKDHLDKVQINWLLIIEQNTHSIIEVIDTAMGWDLLTRIKTRI